MRFVLYEFELTDQGQNGYFAAGRIIDIAPKWNKVTAHLSLVDKIVRDLANGSEALAFCFLTIDFFGGVIEDPISCLHPFQGGSLAVVCLHKSTLHAA